MGSFDILFSEVYGIQNSFGIYNQNLQNACSQILTSIDTLTSSNTSFSGKGAEAIKAYFQETHGCIADSIITLSQLIAQEYSSQFYDQLHSSPVHETSDDARFNADDMQAKVDALRNECSGNIPEATRCLSLARQSFPQGEYFSLPSLAPWRNEIGVLAHDTLKLQQTVEGIDSAASASFSSRSALIAETKRLIENAISFCSNPDHAMSNYVPGSFDSSALRNATALCKVEIEQGFEAYIDSCETSASLEEARVQREAEEAAQREADWAVFNAITATAGMVVGAVGVVVAVCAAATPVGIVALATVGVIGIGLSAAEAGSRVQTAKEKVSAASTVKDGMKQPQNLSASQFGVDTTTRIIEDFDGKDALKKPKSTAVKTGTRIGADLVSNVTASDEQTANAASTVSYGFDLYDGIKDITEKGATKIGKTGGITAVAGVASDVALDYGDSQLEQAQQTSQNCRDRASALDAFKESLKKPSSYAWAGA